jgi:hypothetical protein
MSEAEYSGLNVASAAALEQFFDRMKGRRTAFWMATGEKDFALAATAAAGSSAFLSTGPAIAADLGAIDYAAEAMAVAVFLTDGTKIYRRITDIAASGGNSQITISGTWGVALTTANVARISWMPLWRFASDEMTTSWRSPLHAQARVTFQSVRR